MNNWEQYFASFQPDAESTFGGPILLDTKGDGHVPVEATIGGDIQAVSSRFGGEELPNKLTVLTPDEAAKGISDGYKRVIGKRPSAKILRLLVGQWALETGNGKSVHNYNFGNKKAGKDDPYFQYFRCWEVVGGQKVWYDPPSPVCKFAAYKNAADGAVAYIELLKRRDHWWKGLQTGTTEGFIQGLTTAPAYFTANPGEYAKGLDSRAALYADSIKRYASSVGLQILAGLSVSAGIYYAYTRREDILASPVGQTVTHKLTEAKDAIETAAEHVLGKAKALV